MPITPAEYIRQQTPVPAELRTAEWDAASAQAMERAFVMASVDNARILEAFQRQAAQVAQGGATPAEARRALRAALAEVGYSPAAGLEGTIKDLTTPRRMNVALETNASAAAGWAERQAALQDVGFPAWRLYRAVRAAQPRDWETRWREAAEAVNWVGVARGGVMVALVISPIWAALSRWGTPHAPFDYGSGMDTEPVSFEECVEMGILDDTAREQMAAAMEAEADSFNERVEFEPRLTSEAARAQLADDLRGIAEFDAAGVLRLTDPNGTRPYTAAEIGSVITTPNAAGVPLLQAEAAAQFFTEPERMTLNQREDMARLVNRIVPDSSEATETPLSRGLMFGSEESRAAFLEQVEAGGYAALPDVVAEAWTPDAADALAYAESTAPVVMVCEDYYGARDVTALRAALGDESGAKETLFSARSRFRFLRSEMVDGVLRIYVAEK